MNDDAIERFECTSWASDMESGAEMEPDAAGDWVRYSDHKAAVVSAANAAVDAERVACANMAYEYLTHSNYPMREELAEMIYKRTDAQAALETVKREARNGMMNNLAKRARDAAANAPNRDLLFELSYRIEELEAEAEAVNAVIAQERSEVLALKADNARLQAEVSAVWPRTKNNVTDHELTLVAPNTGLILHILRVSPLDDLPEEGTPDRAAHDQNTQVMQEIVDHMNETMGLNND